MSSDEHELAAACAMWQSGRDGGSSRLRGAARVLTGIPHYFSADFITSHEEAALNQPDARRHARTLLHAVTASAARTPAEWKVALHVPRPTFAGRGLAEKPAEDPQIAEALASGQLTMPLWGVSLDEDVARSFGVVDGRGPRWLFVLDGPVHGVAAWTHSGVEELQYELITGGSYAVERVDYNLTHGATVHLRETAPPSLDLQASS